MNCKNAKQRVLEAINDGTYDPAEGCRWPRDVLAGYTHLSEKTVTRATIELEAEGQLRVIRPRRRGECNTYFVATWSPPLRKRTIARLRKTRPAVLRLREAKCPPNRTAGLCRAQNAVAGPLTKGSYPSVPCSGIASAVVARREKQDIGLRRFSRMEQRRRPSHIHPVPDLTCPKCLELAQEVERKDEIIRQYAENHSKLVEELSGAQAAMRATGKENARLERDLENQKRFVKQLQTKTGNQVVTDEKVQAVIEHWCKHRPRTRPDESFPEDGARRKMISRALKLMSKAEGGDVAAVCEAIDGLHLAPWDRFGVRWGRKVDDKTVLRNTIEYAIADEARIEKCRTIARRARECSLDAKFRAREIAGGVFDAWNHVVMDALFFQAEEAPVVEVDGLVVRP